MSGATHTQHSATGYTWDDFIALPDDDRRELIDGELIEVEVPTGTHEHVVSALGYFLYGWARQNRAISYGSGYKIRIDATRGVMPDLQLYRADNSSDQRDQGLFSGHPDLVVEVLSESSVRCDRVKKLRWYASIGVPEYWIVNHFDRAVERLLLLPSGYYQIRDTPVDEEIFRPESFPGLEIPLAELWNIRQPDEGQ